MIRSELVLCSRGVSLDRDTNNLSIWDLLDGGTAEGFPLVVPFFVGLVVLSREPGDPSVIGGHFELTHAGKQLSRGSLPVNFNAQSRARQIMRIHGLVLPEPGELRFSFFLEGQDEPVASYGVTYLRARASKGESK